AKPAGMTGDSQVDPEVDVPMVDCGEVVRVGLCDDLSLAADLLKSGRQPTESSALSLGPRQQSPFGTGCSISAEHHPQSQFSILDSDARQACVPVDFGRSLLVRYCTRQC